jgi:hypothetical protein
MNNQAYKIKIAIHRSQLAYGFYSNNKLYYNALKIYKANQEIYDLLNKYIYICDNEILDVILSYIFHLEDWFEQFKDLELKISKLDEQFVFIRFEDSPAFPKKILDLI